jgi:regulator of sigma E protease
MSNFLISVGSIIIVLGVMILVHEWGHFIVARMCGVRVDVFSVGMGPRIWGFHRGPTDYRVSALPIGGYVRMAGENPTDERTGDPDEFLSKPRWQRALIILAGPTMNILMALVIAIGMFWAGGQPVPAFMKSKPVVSWVLKDTPAAQAGIQPGDVLLAINGKRVHTWNDVVWKSMFFTPNETLPVLVQNDSHQAALQVHTSQAAGQADLFGYPVEEVTIGSLLPGAPAEKDGLKPGDRILAVDGSRYISREMISEDVAESDGKPVPIIIERGGQTLHLVLHPVYGNLEGQKRWYVGMTFSSPVVPATFGTAVQAGVRYNVMLTAAIVNMVAMLVEHKAKLKQLSGPVGIAKVSGEAAREGLAPFMLIMAIVSLNLGILNLLPIPILDGWHILTLGVEGTIRRDLSMAVKERALQVGLIFLLLLILIVTYNDVLKLITPPH